MPSLDEFEELAYWDGYNGRQPRCPKTDEELFPKSVRLYHIAYYHGVRDHIEDTFNGVTHDPGTCDRGQPLLSEQQPTRSTDTPTEARTTPRDLRTAGSINFIQLMFGSSEIHA